jgi:hypothetical protein
MGCGFSDDRTVQRGDRDMTDEKAEARAERLAKALRRAWDLFQNSGVMREPDGKTGSPELDELGNLLDEMAAFDAALANTEEK